MTAEHADILIVGAGHAGAHLAAVLRQKGFEGSIVLIGAEPYPPYERPPLSKDYLKGERRFSSMLLRKPDYWSERRINLVLGRRVEAIDAGRHLATCDNGDNWSYSRLVWAAGGEPRRLSCPGGDLPGVHAIRARADVDALALDMASARRAVIVGGGYIGLEAAAGAVAVAPESHVTLVEAQPRLLSRVSGPTIAGFYERLHRRHGVDIRLGAAVERVEAVGRHAGAVVLKDGSRIEAEGVVVGIGILPAVAPLLAAGAKGADGVDVDAYCRTTLPNIHAIGDCARHPNRFADGAAIRLESVQNAHDQALVVASDLMGHPTPYDAVPWFWSNQFDVKLQTVGLAMGWDEEIARGDPSSDSFSVLYRRAGRVIALDCVNLARDFVQGRALVQSGAIGDASRLADPTIPLKAMAIP